MNEKNYKLLRNLVKGAISGEEGSAELLGIFSQKDVRRAFRVVEKKLRRRGLSPRLTKS
jgi:hypothetical protein